MNDPTSTTCPRCGTAIPAGATEELCPACLLSGALESPDASPDPHKGAEFPRPLGAYRLLGVLGSGGMGTVYEAEHLATGRRVALKVLDQRLDSPPMRKRFLREGRLAARVNHPNSLYVFGSEEIEDAPVITMEIAAGGTLEDHLEKQGPFPVAKAVDAILDVISGLEAASACGVLHRDVKPSNCFVEPDGTVKVGDFGLSVSTLAREDSLVTAAGVIIGTPMYAPPEQLRGDELDLRADIYSVGATLFSLLTGVPPFEGKNVVQVVANAINQSPKSMHELREGLPPALEQIVLRCMAKEPEGRYDDYATLRSALLPFSSKEAEPASILVRLSAGWIDYLIAFLPPYVALMFLVGAGQLLVQPLVERTLWSARYYFLLLACGLLYFALAEGIWGGGIGKRLKGLQVRRTNGRLPGIGRALIRILVPLLLVEGVRMPIMLALISEPEWTGLQTASFVLGFVVCGWIPALGLLRARQENGFATLWDQVSSTRVVVKPVGSVRAVIDPVALHEGPVEEEEFLGPYRILGDAVPGRWIAAMDPVLRRQVWLLRRDAPDLTLARRNVARTGRLRWLQEVVTEEATWDVFEAARGRPYRGLVAEAGPVPWETLRNWLHDLATELWDAKRDRTLPAELSIDHVWITAEGRAILLDEPWADTAAPAERIPVGDLADQQRFLYAIASSVEATSAPVHARSVLQNLEEGRFEKLSFIAGTLRGLQDRPARVSRGMRAGSLFLLPLYVWIAVYVGYYHDKPWIDPLIAMVNVTAVVMLGAALARLLALPFRSTVSHSIFRLAVVNARGDRASVSHLLVRWGIVWLPLLLPVGLLILLTGGTDEVVRIAALAWLLLWLGAAGYAVLHPNRGLHDRLAHTWVVRR